MYLTKSRYNEIEEEVADMFEESGLHTIPIDPESIAKALGYIVIPYSAFSDENRYRMMQISKDGFSKLKADPSTGMLRFVIYINDDQYHERKRFTLFHEIGHCRLGHFEDRSSLSYEEQESEANHFAKYAMAPNPLIHVLGVSEPLDLYDQFDTSLESAGYTFNSYKKWLDQGPDYYLAYERRILEHFSAELS